MRWIALIRRKRQEYLEELYRANPQLRPTPSMTAKSSEIFSIDRKLVFVGLGALLVVGVMFGVVGLISVATTDPSARGRAPVNVSPTPMFSAANGSASEDGSKSSSFAAISVCSLPAQVLTNSAFAKLGGGRWQKWSDAGGELDYACEGGTDLIKLKKDDTLDISAEYSVLGNSQSAHYISVEYSSFRYAGPSETEKTFRRQYADFCDRLAMKLYGKRLSEPFKNRLLNESTYSTAGTANSYHERVGIGFIDLSSIRNDKMVMLDVHFFPSESDFRTYKDS